MRPVILIPAYKPNDKLLRLAKSITEHYELIVVNDGSGGEYESIFAELKRMKNVVVLNHAINLGKGEALKTGFNAFLNHYANHSSGIVSADADGQHLIADIIHIAQMLESTPNTLHLGARSFEKDIPFKSKIGNVVTRQIFRLLLGTKLQDTQTGLRGIPADFLPTLLRTKSSGYEFELDMLVLAHRHKIPLQETPITTVYEDNNKSSHFNPILDSLKIYYVFFRFLFFAVISGILDFCAFTLSFMFVPQIFFAESLARLFSGTCNFYLNKGLVFRSKAAVTQEALKYTALCAVNLIFSYGFITSLVYLGLNVHTSKIIALIGLFFANFAIQKLFIFSDEETSTPINRMS